MKAYSLYGIGDLRSVEVSKPQLKSGWALIKVKACGICSSDIPRIFTNGTYHFPTIPGHEFSGEVVEVCDECDKSWKGARVGIFPLIPCGKCEQCKRGEYEMCIDYDYIGSRRDGAFAEYVAAPIWNLIKLPDGITYAEAALLEPLAVARHSLGNDVKGKKVAVIGSGMIGFSAAKLALALGAESSVVIGRSDAKRPLAESIGVDYATTDKYRDGTFDLTIEAVGRSESIESAILITKCYGTIVLVGNPYGDITLNQKIYWQILRRQITIRGTWNSRYESGRESDWTSVLELMKSGKIDVKPLITHRFDFSKLNDALETMRDRNSNHCKVIIETE